MGREMVINAAVHANIRVAILADRRLEEFFEESEDRARSRGNIYLGRIRRVEASLDACFVDYGEERHGFLPVGEIVEEIRAGGRNPGSRKLEDMVSRDQNLIVQVDKDPVSTKGARLTTDISLAGRYLVLTPFSETLGVSRRIEDEDERRKHRELFAQLKPPPGMGFILRTAGFRQTKRALAQDMNYLLKLWAKILEKARAVNGPALLHADADIVQRVLRDYYSSDMDQVWIDDPAALERARTFFRYFMPRELDKLKLHTCKTPVFDSFGIEEQIESIHRRKVELPSGGSLVIEQTEALVAIDVNSGKMRHHHAQEDTAFETNLEAACEAARQLRLRNLGGIIVIDFIDMINSGHNSSVEKALREGFKVDKARHQIGKISAFGLCTLTRQRIDKAIQSLDTIECPTCKGDGVIREPDNLAVRLLRRIQAAVAEGSTGTVRVRLHPDVANHVQNKHRAALVELEQEFGVRILIDAAFGLSPSEEQIDFQLQPGARVVPACVDGGTEEPVPSSAPPEVGMQALALEDWDPTTEPEPAEYPGPMLRPGPAIHEGPRPQQGRSSHSKRRRRRRRHGGGGGGEGAQDQRPLHPPQSSAPPASGGDGPVRPIEVQAPGSPTTQDLPAPASSGGPVEVSGGDAGQPSNSKRRRRRRRRHRNRSATPPPATPIS